jgi:nitronate monooxygenase
LSIRTPLTTLLGITHPVIAAPMAFVSGGALAAAVSNAGGLGFLAGGYAENRDFLQRELRAAATRASASASSPGASPSATPALLDLALDHAPAAVWLSFGDAGAVRGAGQGRRQPAHPPGPVRGDGREAVDLGADVIVAQGAEAGGHGDIRSTLPLVPAVVDAVHPVPVVAAGGIADGRGLAAALMLGAAGVACGTAFYAADEALAHPAAKARLVAASGDATQRSSVTDVARRLEWPGSWTIRTLENDFTRRWRNEPGALRADPAEIDRYAAARDAGDFATAAVIAGEAADLVRAVEPAVDILSRMVGEAEALLRAAPGHLA